MAEAKNRTKAPDRVAWPASEVMLKPLPWLKAFARNPRIHGVGQVAQIARSITRFGWTVPVLCAEDGEIIAGHGRVLAAQQLDLKEVPVVIATGWSEQQRREYLILDNRLSEVAEWDNAALAAEIKRLETSGSDVTALGFSASELEKVMAALNSSFLNDLTAGAAGARTQQDADERNLAANGVQLMLTMLPADRQTVIAWLNSERMTRGLGTISQALIAIAREAAPALAKVGKDKDKAA